MQEIKVTWKMAAEVLFAHFRLSLLLTAIALPSLIILVGVCIKLMGYNISLNRLYDQRYIWITLVLVFYFIPINMWALKKILRRKFSAFRITATANEPDMTAMLAMENEIADVEDHD